MTKDVSDQVVDDCAKVTKLVHHDPMFDHQVDVVRSRIPGLGKQGATELLMKLGIFLNGDTEKLERLLGLLYR